MFAFLLRRVLQTVPIILAVALLIFVLFSVIPGTFASSLGDDGRNVMDAQVIERINRQLGLGDPLHVRFGNYVRQLASFDLGTSFRASR
jgi:glutathione transport system permease protein